MHSEFVLILRLQLMNFNILFRCRSYLISSYLMRLLNSAVLNIVISRLMEHQRLHMARSCGRILKIMLIYRWRV